MPHADAAQDGHGGEDVLILYINKLVYNIEYIEIVYENYASSVIMYNQSHCQITFLRVKFVFFLQYVMLV